MVSQLEWFAIRTSSAYLCFCLLSSKRISTKTMIGCDGVLV